jgi:signal transduction histidine kinase/DNA-binding response OmpR family regulator
MKYSNLSPLYQVQELLVAHKSVILQAWIDEDECAEILDRHAIAIDFFMDEYASNIFDYFMGVVSGKVEIGQCPVMAKLIDYLKGKEIRAEELFLICAYFKRSMINATYDLNVHSQELFVSISHLFDMNFAGILRLYTDTIYQKEQEAIEAGQAKEYFLSNMSHEIRTPLNAILGFVGLLKAESLGVRMDKYLDIIAKSGENLLHIINDILDFTKLHSGEFAIDLHPCNIYEGMSNTIELFIPSANLKSIGIDYTINPAVPRFLLADSFRIQQIVSNLLSNAIKFSPVNQTIEVKVDRVEGILTIGVRDFGEGIDLADQERIFDPFYQAAQGTKFGVGGSGLGLSICRQLAMQMGGGITLESRIGWGSLFTVSLPVDIVLQGICETETVDKITNFFTGNVLVAEDNEANQELIRIVLEQFGLKAQIVSNGRKALEKVISTEYDLVFMDEQMPIMNGNEALEEIRKYQHAHQKKLTPIVRLSANVMKGSRERALELGYDALIGKPFGLGDIEAVLKLYLPKAQNIPVPSDEGLEMVRLQDALKLEPDQIRRLLELFHRKMGEMLDELNNALEDKDYEKVSSLAHTIKGSSGNFRFNELSHLANTIETSAHQKNTELRDQINSLIDEYQKIKKRAL